MSRSAPVFTSLLVCCALAGSAQTPLSPEFRVNDQVKQPQFEQVVAVSRSGEIFVAWESMTEDESRPIIDYLVRHACKPDYTTRLRWRQGTLALLDNRCLQHIAHQDYSGHRREMLRCECMADEPPFGPALPRKAAAAKASAVSA